MRFAYQPLPGEPNQLCNLVAAGIIDEYLRRDPQTKIKCIVNGGHGALFVSGEVLTTQDFDVGQLVHRILGTYGLFQGIEPFVALEPVPSQLVDQFRMPSTEPVLVSGYATLEDASLAPRNVRVAREIAKMLFEKRLNDPEWFWMGLAGSVTVTSGGLIDQIFIQVDHGTQKLEDVREQISNELVSWNELQDAKIKINPLGPREKTDLEFSVGHSSQPVFPYGSALPIVQVTSQDLHATQVSGQILARQLARFAIRNSEAQAVLVRLSYGPGDCEPEKIEIRDEKSRDLSHLANGHDLNLENAAKRWQKPCVLSDLAKWGLTNPDLPWEA